MPSVLFVCQANRFRSPLAAAYFVHCLEQQVADRESWSVGSAGTWTEEGLPAESSAIKFASGWGLDLKAHRSRQVNANIISQSNLILVMEASQKEALQIEFPKERSKTFLLSEMVDGKLRTIPDPFGPEGVPYQEIILEIFDLIKHGFDRICQLALDTQNTIR
jgi:protein-tyrosine phosphatase